MKFKIIIETEGVKFLNWMWFKFCMSVNYTKELQLFKEGSVSFYASKNNLKTKRSVFYNPMMRINRDFTVLLLKSLFFANPKRKFRILDLMAASGVRALRIWKEVGLDSIDELIVNDISRTCYNTIRKNFEINGFGSDGTGNAKIFFENENALKLLLKEGVFDFVQVDPFEDVNKYLQLAISKIRNRGVLALTSIDTASLSGVYPKTCLRRYDSIPQKFDFKHEFGLRILIRNIQLIGAKQGKKLIPLLCYQYKHHFGIFMRVVYGRKRADSVFNNHKYLLYCKKCLHRRVSDTIFNKETCELCGSKLYSAGKFYTGSLWDKKLVTSMFDLISTGDNIHNLNKKKNKAGNIGKNTTLKITEESKKYLDLIKREAGTDVPFTFNTHLISKFYKIKPKSIDKVISNLRERGFNAEKTHFNPLSIRTNAQIQDIMIAMRS